MEKGTGKEFKNTLMDVNTKDHGKTTNATEKLLKGIPIQIATTVISSRAKLTVKVSTHGPTVRSTMVLGVKGSNMVKEYGEA
jgi:hypothetical protein